MTETQTPNSAVRKPLRALEGIVSKVSGDKTVRVDMAFQMRHEKYGKIITRRTRVLVHDEGKLAGEGDRVEIAECRPISRHKHHRLVKVLEKAPEKVTLAELQERLAKGQMEEASDNAGA